MTNWLEKKTGIDIDRDGCHMHIHLGSPLESRTNSSQTEVSHRERGGQGVWKSVLGWVLGEAPEPAAFAAGGMGGRDDGLGHVQALVRAGALSSVHPPDLCTKTD